MTVIANAPTMRLGVTYERCGMCGRGTPRGMAPSSVTLVECQPNAMFSTVGITMANSAPN